MLIFLVLGRPRQGNFDFKASEIVTAKPKIHETAFGWMYSVGRESWCFMLIWNRKDVIVQNRFADTYSLSVCSLQTLSAAWTSLPSSAAPEVLDQTVIQGRESGQTTLPYENLPSYTSGLSRLGGALGSYRTQLNCHTLFHPEETLPRFRCV